MTPDPSAIDRLQAICERLSPMFRAEKIIARQACFRLVTQDGMPLIGKVLRSEGAYVASGHNVWGILNAPATGEALAELIADGVARSTDLTPFDPIRLRPLGPSFLHSAPQLPRAGVSFNRRSKQVTETIAPLARSSCVRRGIAMLDELGLGTIDIRFCRTDF